MTEMQAASANVVLAIDRSQSMEAASKLPAARTSASTFLTVMSEHDHFAVTSFASSARALYPAGVQKLATATEKAVEEATAAIQTLTASGRTDIKGAISISHAFMTNVAAPRGIVLLSDGLWNEGGNPVPPPTDVPIYTIAAGGQFDPSFLREIAKATRGKYYETIDAWGLYEIYNDILGQTKVARAMVNEDAELGRFRFQMIPVPIAAGMNSWMRECGC